MMDTLKLEVNNKLSELPRLNGAVHTFGQIHQWEESLCRRIQLIVEELLVNIICHGGTEGDHCVRIQFKSSSDLIEITLEDDARPFNPIIQPAPDLDVLLEEREPGGLGLHLVKNMVDDLIYHRRDHKNILIIKKYRSSVRHSE